MKKHILICVFISIILLPVLSFAQANNKNGKNMNETLKTIHSRKSVRTFANKEVSKNDLETLVRAGMAAPSSRNIQPWSFYVISNKATLQKLANGLKNAQMLAKAPAAIIVCGDNTKGIVEPDQALNWALDCSAATQNILLAAESIGLGATWTGVFPYKARVKVVKELLGLPDNIIPLNAIPIGYPDGNEKAKDKFKTENIIWLD